MESIMRNKQTKLVEEWLKWMEFNFNIKSGLFQQICSLENLLQLIKVKMGLILQLQYIVLLHRPVLKNKLTLISK